MLEPYNYTFDPDLGYYTFLTKDDIEYKIAFFEDFMLDSCSDNKLEIGPVYQITVEKISDKTERLDARVSETVRDIISAFFLNEEQSLIYICDNDDVKGYKRFNAFERWFKNSNMTGYITKLDNIVEIDEITIHTSLMFHNNNTNTANIKIAYEGISGFLNAKP